MDADPRFWYPNELLLLDTLAELENVTAAAEKLRVSQSALSRMLGRIERDLGIGLFDRPGKRIKLNVYGRIFHEHVKRAIEELEAAQRRVSRMVDPDCGQIRLAYLPWIGVWLIPDLVREFHAEAPSVEFLLSAAPSLSIAGDLHRGHVDLILTTRAPGEPEAEETSWLVVHRSRLNLVVSPAHPLAGRPSVSLEELRTERFIMPRRASGLGQMIEQMCARAGLVPETVLECHELETIRGFVAAGLGVAILPTGNAALHAAHLLTEIPLLADTPYREIGAAWHSHRKQPPVVERFLSYLESRARSSAVCETTGGPS